jgi:hypothetical protein
MTDVYISFAREDQERVRPLAEALQLEGWDVWWDPSAPDGDSRASLDQKLGSAGAILVVWSAYSRGSEYVRSEAATGLYKNKLIQTRVDSAAPPRPFDQVEVTDLSLWSGEREDPSWRRVVQAVRLFAGAPGARPSAPKPQRAKKQSAAMAPPQSEFTASKPDFLERERSIAWAPIAAAGVLVLAGVGIWFVDPFGWRGAKASQPVEEAAVTATVDPAAAAVPGEFQDTEESDAAWNQVDRSQAASLREYFTAYPRTSTAETARSLLRVLDAQAWVDAVTSDNEMAYTSYLKNFPDDGPAPGAMAVAARDRLASLNLERLQAIEEIQRGLQALELYTGKIDGKPDSATVKATRQFASLKRKPAPMLSSAAPRDLRQFSDLIQKQALAEGKTIAPPTILAAAPPPAAATKPPAEPIIAAATVAPSTAAKPPAAAAPPPAAAQGKTATELAEAADRQRREQAQAAAAAAKKETVTPAEDPAAGETKRTAEQVAWERAENTGTAAAYQTYLTSYPAGARAADARAAVSRLNRTASSAPSAASAATGYNVDVLSAEVKLAVEAARRAQTTANSRASAARETASQATSAAGIRPITAANGDRYETQISGGAPNGLGSRTSGGGRTAGDRYRGEIRNGQAAGLGVYEYADNAGNSRRLTRYEGEHAGDQASGYGVTYWRNGDSFSGLDNADTRAARGVMSIASGQRYEGEMRNGQRSGIGVVWSGDGQVQQAGRWENGQLVQSMAQ